MLVVLDCKASGAVQRAGLPPTGILANAAKSLGFTSVAALLAVNPDAAQVVQAVKEPKSQAQVCQLLLPLQHELVHLLSRAPTKASMHNTWLMIKLGDGKTSSTMAS